MNSECYGQAQLSSDIKYRLVYSMIVLTDILLIKMTIQLLQSNFEVHVQTIKILKTRSSKNGLARLAHKQLTQVANKKKDAFQLKFDSVKFAFLKNVFAEAP